MYLLLVINRLLLFKKEFDVKPISKNLEKSLNYFPTKFYLTQQSSILLKIVGKTAPHSGNILKLWKDWEATSVCVSFFKENAFILCSVSLLIAVALCFLSFLACSFRLCLGLIRHEFYVIGVNVIADYDIY